MKLSRNSNNQQALIENSKFKLAQGSPVIIRFDEIIPGNEPAIKGHLIVEAFGTKENTRVTIKQAPSAFAGRDTLRSAIDGTETIAALRKGDIIGFESAYVEDGIALVGKTAVRVHDNILGATQVMTAMVCPSKSIVNKNGASQRAIIADGKKATVVKNFDEIKAAFNLVKASKWPGGQPGFLIRGQDEYVGEFFEEKNSGIDHLIEELEHNEILGKTGQLLELVPAWRLSMGREQVMRDVNVSQPTEKPVIGSFGSKFKMKKGGLGYLPCLLVVAKEEEWAFGAKTGKIIPVISSMTPVYKREPVSADRLPTIKRAYGGSANTVLNLYDDAALLKMNKERIEIRGFDLPEGTNKPIRTNTEKPTPRFGRSMFGARV